MKKLLIYLDYHCFPLWLYNEDGSVEQNSMIPELCGNKHLENLFIRISKTYDSFFQDDDTIFAYNGPASEGEQQQREQDLRKAFQIVKETVGDSYEVAIDYESIYADDPSRD